MDIFELEGAQGVASAGGRLLVSQEVAVPTMGQVNCRRLSHCTSRRVMLRSSERTPRRSTWPRTDTSSPRSLIRLALISLSGSKSRVLRPQKPLQNALCTFRILVTCLGLVQTHTSDTLS